ncbi:MAG: hypothetical protein KTR25_13615 [Myxococcales bacterium]|nr:hypothetical protein [Myxococcales bacterium]
MALYHALQTLSSGGMMGLMGASAGNKLPAAWGRANLCRNHHPYLTTEGKERPQDQQAPAFIILRIAQDT